MPLAKACSDFKAEMADPDDPDAPVDRPRKNETRTNLIVNYLPQFFRDEELYSLFVAVVTIMVVA